MKFLACVAGEGKGKDERGKLGRIGGGRIPSPSRTHFHFPIFLGLTCHAGYKIPKSHVLSREAELLNKDDTTNLVGAIRFFHQSHNTVHFGGLLH